MTETRTLLLYEHSAFTGRALENGTLYGGCTVPVCLRRIRLEYGRTVVSPDNDFNTEELSIDPKGNGLQNKPFEAAFSWPAWIILPAPLIALGTLDIAPNTQLQCGILSGGVGESVLTYRTVYQDPQIISPSLLA